MVEHELPEDEPGAKVEAFSQFGGKKRKTSKKHAKKAGKKTGKKSGKKVVKKSKKKVVGKKTRKSVGKKKLGKRKTLRGGSRQGRDWDWGTSGFGFLTPSTSNDQQTSTNHPPSSRASNPPQVRSGPMLLRNPSYEDPESAEKEHDKKMRKLCREKPHRCVGRSSMQKYM